MATEPWDLYHLLFKLDACSGARNWARNRTVRQAWFACDRGDWLLWFAFRLDVDRRYVIAAACACLQGASWIGPKEKEHIGAMVRWTQGVKNKHHIKRIVTMYLEDEPIRVVAETVFNDPFSYDSACEIADVVLDLAHNNSNCDEPPSFDDIMLICARRIRKVIPWSMVEERFSKALEVYS